MKLSLKRYGWKCVLGTEVFYITCMVYGRSLTGRAREFHQTFFEMLPGFSWSNPIGTIWGGIYLFGFAWLFAWYYVWMFNTSQEG